jgi:hypothetical protein
MELAEHFIFWGATTPEVLIYCRMVSIAVKCVGQGERIFRDTASLEMNPLMKVERIFFLQHF